MPMIGFVFGQAQVKMIIGLIIQTPNLAQWQM